MTRICDLPNDLVGETILTKVPITSLKAVRSTCKSWNGLSNELLVGKATTTRDHEFIGFMTLSSKVCSLRFDLEGIHDDIDMFKPSIKPVALLNQVEVSEVFHCNGLLLCVTKDNSRLVVWNPYLRQIRWIKPRKHFQQSDKYALGYDNNRTHKILRLSRDNVFRFNELEIYDFVSDSWRVLDITRHFYSWRCIYQSVVTLKGNTYFLARNEQEEFEDFFICFDFTRERFGKHLPLPGLEACGYLSLSCVREEQLAVLFQKPEPAELLKIWLTNKIEPNAVSWSKLFLKIDLSALNRFMFYWEACSFFIDEEKKLAVVFDEGLHSEDRFPYLTAYIIGEDGYFNDVSLEETRDSRLPRNFSWPLVSSSYLPSLVQIKQPLKKEEEDA